MHEVTKRVEGTFFTVSAKFLNDGSNRRYTYKVPDHYVAVAMGDLAVVHTNTGYKLVEIVEVHNTPQIDYTAPYEYRWLVDVVDTKEFVLREKHERQYQKELAAKAEPKQTDKKYFL